jgi:membrane protease YdiL (CAAX protease family)
MVVVRKWRLEALGHLVLGLLLGLSLGGTLVTLLQPPEAHEFGRFLLTTLCFHGATFGCVHLFLREHGERWGEVFGLRLPGRLRTLGLAAGVTLLALPCAWFMGWASGEVIRWFQVEPELQPAVLALRKTTLPHQQYIMGAIAVLVAPLAEEILFRGILYPLLKGRFGPIPACVLASLAFSAIHFNLMSFVPLFFLAVLFTWLYEQTANLLAPVLAHSLFNSANVLFLLAGGGTS